MWFDEERQERHGQNPLSQGDGSITPRPSSQWRETNSLRNGTELQEQAAHDIEFNKDSMQNTIEQIETQKQYKVHHPINCNAPPIIGYTGHISHMTDSECSLGRGYHGSAMKALKLVEKETEEIDAKEKEVEDALDEEMEKRDALENQGHGSRSSSDIEFNKDSMKNTIEQIEIQKQYKVHHPINCNAPPIIGYTGHISHMTDSECSLGRGYHGSAMKALKLVEKETEEIDAKEKEVEDALDEEMEKRDALENQGHGSRSSSDIEFNKDSMKNTIEQIEIQKQYKVHHPINCNAPPIIGYTGHISHMTDSECSLGRGYHGSAMKALKLVEKETEEIDAKEKEVKDALDEEMENRDALENQGHGSRSSSDIEFNKDSMKNTIEQIEIQKQYKVHHPINCNAPPIIGYTGHISHMTDSECSLGRGYHGSAMKALKLVEKETEEIDAKEKEVKDALDEEMENRDALEKSNVDEEEAIDKEAEIKAALDRATASNDEYRRGLHTGRRMYNNNELPLHLI